MQKHLLLVLGVLMVLTFLGCPAEPEDKPAAPVYGIEVDRTSYAYYGPTGNVFTSPQPYAITVTNTGNAATGDIALRLVYDETPPAIAPIAISMDWAAEAVIASIPQKRQRAIPYLFVSL